MVVPFSFYRCSDRSPPTLFRICLSQFFFFIPCFRKSPLFPHVGWDAARFQLRLMNVPHGSFTLLDSRFFAGILGFVCWFPQVVPRFLPLAFFSPLRLFPFMRGRCISFPLFLPLYPSLALSGTPHQLLKPNTSTSGTGNLPYGLDHPPHGR